MRHRSKRSILSRTSSARSALLRQLAAHLIVRGRMTTTVAKAKLVRPLVERMITLAKEPSIAHRRLLHARLANDAAVKKLMTEIGPKYASRPGGYTRITKLGVRQGDAGQTAMIELI